MNDSNLDPYLESLRDCLPSEQDEARVARRLASAGLVLAVAGAAQVAVASTAKASLLSLLSARFAALPLWAQVSWVATTTTLVATGPVVVVLEHQAPLEREKSSERSQAVREHVGSKELSTTSEASAGTPREAVPATAESAVASPVTSSLPSRTAALPERRPATTLGAAGDHVAFADSPLAQETQLIDAALGAIQLRNFSVADQLLRQHAERYPNGRLLLERQRALQKLAAAREAPSF